MKFNLYLLSFILCMIITSCSDNTEDLFESSAINESRLSTESTYLGNSGVLSRSSADDDVSDVVTTGYTSVENGSNMKLLFSSQLANLTGLQAGSVYITRFETFHKKIDLNGASFFDDELYNECGLRRHQDINGGYISYTERGYNAKPVGTNQMDMTTHLIHVISDMSGRKLDIYYPCKPSEIKWHYFLFK